MSPTLLVLAAGKGSRFGGAKQFEPIGPQGQPMLDYSVHDAVEAGFGRVVFVVSPDAMASFGDHAAKRYARRVAVECVAQSLDDLPSGFLRPAGRTRPWGTLHAVLAARHRVHGPFAVVNADDFYGAAAFRQLATFLAAPPEGETPLHCMVAYALARTLSGHGGVNRGICTARGGLLTAVEEHTDITMRPDGVCEGADSAGVRVPLDPDAAVSMNVWGYQPSAWGAMQAHFMAFLEARGHALEAECYLPAFVDSVVQADQARCRMLHTDDSWCGMTYREDKAACVHAMARLTSAGFYPAGLWEAS